MKTTKTFYQFNPSKLKDKIGKRFYSNWMNPEILCSVLYEKKESQPFVQYMEDQLSLDEIAVIHNQLCATYDTIQSLHRDNDPFFEDTEETLGTAMIEYIIILLWTNCYDDLFDAKEIEEKTT